MKHLILGKLGVILLFIFLFTIFLSCSDGKLAKENAELRTENEALKKQINELKSKTENQSKQVMKEAVEALRKIKARSDVGISHSEFTSLLGETLYKVNLFLESQESAKRPELTESVRKVFSHYMRLKELWGYSLRTQRNLYIREDDPFWQEIVSSYPRAKWDDIQFTIQLIWKEADEELKKMVNLLSQE